MEKLVEGSHKRFFVINLSRFCSSHWLFLLIGIMICGPQVLYAQDDAPSGPADEQYPKAFGSFDYNKIDSVNLENGKLNLNIPVFSYPQRGGALSLGFTIGYQSLSYYSIHSDCTDETLCNGVPYGVSGGLYLSPSFLIDADNPGRGYSPLVSGTGFMSVDGSGHQMFPCGANNSPYPGQQVRTDDAGIVYSQTCGSYQQNFSETITDSNGNQIVADIGYESNYGGSGGFYAIQGWTDTMGRYISFP